MASLAGQLLKMGDELEEEYRDVLDRRAANRRSLRDLATQGLLSEEEVAKVDALYPPRERKTEATA